MALEQASTVRAIIFDNPGTLTVGQPRVVAVVTAGNPLSEDELLALTGSAEQSSEHPIAQAIVQLAKERGLRSRTRPASRPSRGTACART